MSSLLEIGTRSLTASQYALSITSQNIANANTPFYSRREVDFSEAFDRLFGSGVNVSDVRRIFDDAANKSLLKINSEFGKSSTFTQNIKGLELLFDNSSNGITDRISESRNALNAINSNPSLIQPRELYLYQINNMAAQFNRLDNQLEAEQKNVNNALVADVTTINNTLQKLAQLNDKIVNATADERLDILDARDALTNTLSTYIGVETRTDNMGVLNITLSNGTPLLLGNTASTLATIPAPGDANQLDIVLTTNQSHTVITNMITSGEIAGQINYQKNALVESKNALGRLALVFSQKMNQQNKLGIDLQANLGGNIFKDINTDIATKNRVFNNMSNQGTGDMTVFINDASQLTSSDYQLTFDTPTHYQLMRKSDNQMVSSGNASTFPVSINADGFSIKIANGNFVSGDQFTITPTKYGARDISVDISDPGKLALGSPVIAESSSDNQGRGQIALTAMLDTTTSAFSIPKQLNPPIRVEFVSSQSYQLINANDNSVIESGIAYNPALGADIFPTAGGYDPGYRIHLSGDNQAGDKFSIDYNRNGIADNRNGLVMADLYQQGVLNDNSLNYGQAYQAINNSISSSANSAKITYDSNDIIKKQAETRRDQISGVSLQEEAINITRYQQAYQASAQIIDVGQKIFDTLISLARR